MKKFSDELGLSNLETKPMSDGQLLTTLGLHALPPMSPESENLEKSKQSSSPSP